MTAPAPAEVRPEWITDVHLAILLVVDVHDRKATSTALSSPEITYTLNNVARMPLRFADTNTALSQLRADARLTMYRDGPTRTKRFRITPTGRALLPPPAPTRR